MLDDGSTCPHCKTGTMRGRSAIVDVGIPNTGDKTELVCDMCRHRVVKIDFHESIKVREYVEAKKIPSPDDGEENKNT